VINNARFGAIFFIVAAIIIYPRAILAVWDFHPGLYNSFEYTDNYFGSAHDQKSESILEVGPSLVMSYAEPQWAWNLEGRWARSFHGEYDEDDFYEVSVASDISIHRALQACALDYSYTQTSRRDSLDETWGRSRIHSLGATYQRDLTIMTGVSLGYNASRENNEAAGDDLVSHGGSIGISHQINQTNSMNISVGHNIHDFEQGEDTASYNADVHWMNTVTERLQAGLGCGYVHSRRDESPDEDSYSVRANIGYSPTVHIDLDISGGYTWLNQEDLDRQGSYTMSAGVLGHAEHDRFTLRASREYTEEYTSERYGTYNTRTVSFGWDRDFSRTISTSASISHLERKPTADTEEEDEKDTTTAISLLWNPNRYATFSPYYTYLRHGYEISDTIRESRYGITIEVRY